MSDHLDWYLRHVGRYPLLTASQEIMLARQIADGKEPMASRARRKMFLCNLRYVVNLAKKYAKRVTTMDVDDLIQHGNIGLNKAIDKFDPERGYKFSTYSRHWIQAYINRGVSHDDPLIRLPDNTRDLMLKVRRVTGELMVGLGRNPTLAEIAAAAGVDLAFLDVAATYGPRHASLDAGPDGAPLLDYLPSAETNEPDDRLDTSRLLLYLSERERYVIRRYFGLGGGDPVSTTVIGKELGVSPSRAADIRLAALAKLRQQLKA